MARGEFFFWESCDNARPLHSFKWRYLRRTKDSVAMVVYIDVFKPWLCVTISYRRRQTCQIEHPNNRSYNAVKCAPMHNILDTVA